MTRKSNKKNTEETEQKLDLLRNPEDIKISQSGTFCSDSLKRWIKNQTQIDDK